jgi:hypothetical protein
MSDKITTFKKVLENIEEYSCRCWVYMPSEDKWHIGSKSAVLENEEVPPEFEDGTDAGVPAIAKANNLMQALPVSEIQDIVRNAKAQASDVSVEKLFEAFIYYYDNDSYIQLAGEK